MTATEQPTAARHGSQHGTVLRELAPLGRELRHAIPTSTVASAS
jgi:hypothetical protein